MIARGNALQVVQALVSLGKNRLPLRQTEVILEAKRRAVDVIKKGKELHQILILQYDPTGKGWASLAEAPPELVSKLLQFNSQLIELDLGGSIALADLPPDVLLDVPARETLEEVGFLT